MINLGVLIIAIVLLGYISNWLNWRYLNFPIVRFLYRVGVIIHEFSHAILCCLTGAGVTEIKLFSDKPYITYTKPKIPFLGNFLIALAPIFGGLAILFLLNKFFLSDYFISPEISDIGSIFFAPLHILLQINLLEWQSWLMIFLFLNIGAMIGPSFQDLKNIWPLLIIAFFIKSVVAITSCLLVVSLILTNLLIQAILIIATALLKKVFRINS